MTKKRVEYFLIICISVWTLIYLIGTIKLGLPIVDGEPSSSLFPWLVIIAMILGCLGLIYEINGKNFINEKIVPIPIIRPLAGCIVIGTFIGLLYCFGYWIASIFLCFCTAFLFEYTAGSIKKAVTISSIVGIIVPIICYVFYQMIFHIRLP